ncbi:MAG: hypothetical protein HY867_16970 [Chloroflexi bacterium]|nr:hypothetical protein [Chloroflexota bacterium]
MKLSKEKIQELWILRASVYNSKKLGVWSAILIPSLLLLIGPISISEFEKAIIYYSILGYLIYLTAILIILHNLKRLKGGKTRSKFTINKTLLLKSIYELALLFMVFASFFVTAIQILFKIFQPTTVAMFSLLALVVYTVLLVLISPKVLNYRSIDRPEYGNKYLPLAIAISGIAPGLGILAYNLLPHSNTVDMPLYLILFCSILIFLCVLPVVVINFYEVILLTFSEWPRLKKVGSKYEIVNLDG